MNSGADLPESVEEGAATGSVEATGETVVDPLQKQVDEFVAQQPMGQKLQLLMSNQPRNHCNAANPW